MEKTERERGCNLLAKRQHGCFSREQVLRLGFSRHAVRRKLLRGLWIRLRPTVFASAASSDGWFRKMTAAILWAGPGAALSHRAAAQLWGLADFSIHRVELSSERWLRPVLPSDTVHRAHVDGADLCLRDRLPVTSPERMLFDLASVESDRYVEELIDALLRRGLVDMGRIKARLDAQKGRRGFELLRRLVKDRAVDPAVAESPLETALYALIRKRGLPLPRRQWSIMEGDQCIGRLDLAYPALMLGIEGDGYAYHSSHQAWQRDHTRDNALVAKGWTLLRFTRADVHQRPDEVATRLREALARSALRQTFPIAAAK